MRYAEECTHRECMQIEEREHDDPARAFLSLYRGETEDANCSLFTAADFGCVLFEKR